VTLHGIMEIKQDSHDLDFGKDRAGAYVGLCMLKTYVSIAERYGPNSLGTTERLTPGLDSQGRSRISKANRATPADTSARWPLD